MSHYKVETLYGKANPNCVACSPRILLEYTKKGPSFVEALAQNPDLLQSLSGITEILEGMEEVQLEEVDF